MDKNYGYKHTKGFIAFIIFTILLLFIAPAFSQSSGIASTSVDITGNLANNTQTATISTSTWQGGTFVSALTCWAPGDPGYCGPNAMIRPDGNINFSYGLTNLYQNVNVAKALPYSGTNLVTTGYRFEWTSKNGNGWDDGRLDQLSAYVNLYDKGGSTILESYNYNLNFIHNWSTFTWDQNWNKLRRPNEVSNVQFGFVGMDNNYWAGPYGPEINNVSFQLKYKPDPCVNNPLFSPDCPKFQETLQKNLASATTSTDTSTASKEQDTQQNPPPEPIATAKHGPIDDPLKEKDDILGKEEGATEHVETVVNIDRLIDTLIKIQDNQHKEEKITMDAASSAIKETERTSQQTTKQAEQIASRLTRQSIEQSMMQQETFKMENSSKDNKGLQSLSMFQAPTTISLGTFQLPGTQNQLNMLQGPNAQNTTINLGGPVNEQQTKTNQVSIFSLQNQSTQSESVATVVSLLQNNNQFSNQNISTVGSSNLSLTSLANPLAGQLIETPTLQSNFLTNKTDPINSIIEAKPNIQDKKEETNTQQVKLNVQDNDAASGVSIDSIARTPIGFNSYMVALTDASFYSPKEIYRNQKTVDNVRALRQLASDRLHQQMVDQQYLPR
jgi:hypothetical protein